MEKTTLELSRDDLRLILKGLHRLYMQGPSCDDQAILGLMDRVATVQERLERVEHARYVQRAAVDAIRLGLDSALDWAAYARELQVRDSVSSQENR